MTQLSADFHAAAVSQRDGSAREGVHLLWTAPPGAGYSLSGYDIQRRKARQPKLSCYTLSKADLGILHQTFRLTIPSADLAVHETPCPQKLEPLPDQPLVGTITETTPAAGSPQAAPGTLATVHFPGGCRCYRVTLAALSHGVRISATAPAVLAIALLDGKAVDTAFSSASNSVQELAFESRPIDRVLIYTNRPLQALTLCVEPRRKPAAEDEEWKSVPFLAKGIQLPVRQANDTVNTEAEEFALAKSRLLPGEVLDLEAFRELSRMMNRTLEAGTAPPVLYTEQFRDNLEDPFLELRPWPFALASLVNPAWRRALGFAFHDTSDLEAGATYDYRITGHFRRETLDGVPFGFHAVPVGTTLPPTFRSGPVHFDLPAATAVRIHPGGAPSQLRNTGRIGLPLNPAPPNGRSLTLSFDGEISRLVLEFEPAATSTLTYIARVADSLVGLSTVTLTGSISPQPRAEIEFDQPIETLELFGEALLYAVRLPADDESEKLVQRSVVVPGVSFVDTPLPAPPDQLGTTSLQEPVLPADAATATQRPPQALGFRLHWRPPPSTGSPAVEVWPVDLGAAPPFDALAFQIERRQVDTDGAFEPLSSSAGPEPLMFFGNRRTPTQPAQLRWGSDLRELFPDGATTDDLAAIAPMTTEDVLAGPEVAAGPDPGSTFQYRISTLDIIGRRSQVPTVGSVVRLEKHQAPPQPPGPEASSGPAQPLQPAGVRARVLQAEDPNLSPQDLALLAGSDNAIVLEWGWTDEERERDPYASEFRVYWQPQPLDRLRGTLQGPATQVSDSWHMAAALERPVAENELVGRYLRAPDYPFRVAANSGGDQIEIEFELAQLKPTLEPSNGEFRVQMQTEGSDLRPTRWAERTAVIPIGDDAPQPFVFRDRLSVSAEQPFHEVWVGVSAADAQSYVADELPATSTNGGRPGNESSIVGVAATARYLGRPELVPPPPLDSIPEVVSTEPVGSSVLFHLELPSWLPTLQPLAAGHGLLLDRLAATDLLSTVSRLDGDRIGVSFPNGTSTSYQLDNPDDNAQFLAQIASGEAARIEGRFVADLAQRFPAQFEASWKRLEPTPVPLAHRIVSVPSDAERHLFRVRLVDAAGRASAASALLPRVFRVLSTRAPGAPRLELNASADDSLTARASALDTFDLSWVLFFPLVQDDSVPPDASSQESPTVLRLPNRRDLYPHDGIRLRRADGSLLAPVVAPASSATRQPPELQFEAGLDAGFARSVTVWALSLTRDGIPSQLAGPLTATTGPAPLAVPSLDVTTTNGDDLASWGAPASQARIRLERSLDGGSSWAAVSPRLPPNATSYEVRVRAGRRYRLSVEGSGGRVAKGEAVVPTEEDV